MDIVVVSWWHFDASAKAKSFVISSVIVRFAANIQKKWALKFKCLLPKIDKLSDVWVGPSTSSWRQRLCQHSLSFEKGNSFAC